MATTQKTQPKRSPKKPPRRAVRKRKQTGDFKDRLDQVFKFREFSRLASDLGIGSRASTGDKTKDRLRTLLWLFIQKLRTTLLVGVLRILARYAKEPTDVDRLDLDTGDLVRDELLEQIWSCLHGLDTDSLTQLLPILVEIGLEESGELLDGRPVHRGGPDRRPGA